LHRAERRARMPEKSRIECDRTHSVKSPEGQQTSRKARSGRYAAFRRPGHSTSRWAKQRRWTRSSCSYPLCRAKPLTRQRESTPTEQIRSTCLCTAAQESRPLADFGRGEALLTVRSAEQGRGGNPRDPLSYDSQGCGGMAEKMMPYAALPSGPQAKQERRLP